jgi:enoyl-CoA hydratase
LGLSWLLPRIIGVGRAHALLYTGRRFGDAEALEYGLVTTVVPADELPTAALELARAVAAQPPWQTALTKRGLQVALGPTSLADVLELENRQRVLATLTDDYQEAIDSYLGKRTPAYRHR